MTLAGQDFTVVGAGIAGLAVATALARAGAAVRVAEKAEAISEVGAGIQITPNGMAVLAALGLEKACLARGVRAEGVRLRDYRAGAGVLRLDFDRRRHSNPHPYVFLHRADLITILAEAADAAGVRFDLGLELSPEEALAHSGGMVIGADGLRSAMRAALNGEAEPFFTGQVAWRMLVPTDPAEAPPPVAQVWLGPGRHAVTYPVRGGRALNIVAVEERHSWVAEGWSHRDDPETLREAFADFAPELRTWLERAREVYVWGLFRHEVARRWHGDGIAILGDAAHPTLPFLAQGANMALEDAWVLAKALGAAGGDRAAALAAYQAARVPRVSRVVDAANRNARVYHLSNPLGRRATHAAMRLGGAVMPGFALGQFDWVYGEDVTRP
ncbi:monooxygenase [Maritimibacter sp. 55A14]|uniref:FAD-dependent monooxygenase n=1 Tax=Maritimibacter sp. 55A14 TaxID=2174844 RepID=UPI000D60B790|nr:FAD-dependent monooxygenase [Maritimibacter sp. 55A14]PWE33985.1 monooxygenase [Maritimibacter sp. 55A14]